MEIAIIKRETTGAGKCDVLVYVKKVLLFNIAVRGLY